MQKLLCLVFFLVSVRSLDWGINVEPGKDAVFTYVTQTAHFNHAGMDVFVDVEPFYNPNPTGCDVTSFVEINITDTKTVTAVGFDFQVPPGFTTERHTADPYFENCGNTKLEAGDQIPVRVIIRSNCSLTMNGTIDTTFQFTEILLHETKPVIVTPVTKDFDTYLTCIQNTTAPMYLKITGPNATISDFFDSVVVASGSQCINTYDPNSPDRKVNYIPQTTSAEFRLDLGNKMMYYVRLNKKTAVPRRESFTVTLEAVPPTPTPEPNKAGIAIGITLPLLVVVFVVIYLCYRKNQTYNPV